MDVCDDIAKAEVMLYQWFQETIKARDYDAACKVLELLDRVGLI